MATKPRKTSTAAPCVNITSPLIQVGGAGKESIAELRGCINDILTVPGLDNATRQQALQVLSKGVSADNANFSEIQFNMGPGAPAY